MTAEQLGRVQGFAREWNVTLSEYLRRRALQEPAPRPNYHPWPLAMLLAVEAQIEKNLRAAGTNLRQVEDQLDGRQTDLERAAVQASREPGLRSTSRWQEAIVAYRHALAAYERGEVESRLEAFGSALCLRGLRPTRREARDAAQLYRVHQRFGKAERFGLRPSRPRALSRPSTTKGAWIGSTSSPKGSSAMLTPWGKRAGAPQVMSVARSTVGRVRNLSRSLEA